MSRNPIKVGDRELQVAVLPLLDGGFTYTVVEKDHSGKGMIERRYDSGLRFQSEDEAFAGGASDARRRAAKAAG